MHSKIYQISLKPLEKEDYLKPSDLYENSQDFADYIGDEFEGDSRIECIEYLSECLSEFFDYVGNGTLLYKGMGDFLTDWVEQIKLLADSITPENVLKELNLYYLSSVTEKTHKNMSSRFYIEDYNCFAGPLSDLVEFLATRKEGEKIYVGSVIDYHF